MLAKSTVSNTRSRELSDKQYDRFAIYYVPEPSSPLGLFARNWFGYDPENGFSDRDYLGLDPAFVERVTQKPRRYGLHATLKAPFHLAEQYKPAKLLENFRRFTRHRKSFTLGRLKLSFHGDSLVLVPESNLVHINQFASQCVLGFDDFRAPLTVKERTKRLSSGLTAHQRVMLEELGYPYVLSEFQFHITLTSSLTEEEKVLVTEAIAPSLAEVFEVPTEIEQVTLLGDPGQGQYFQVIERLPLAT